MFQQKKEKGMKRLTWLFLIATLTLQAQADVPEPNGVWEFNAPDPSMATIGAPLELVGSAQDITGLDAGDDAIRIGEGSYYICTHGIAPNGDGAKVNEWTLLIDFSYPSSSRSDPPNGYNDLFQTDPTNASDADWTINSSGAIGIGAVGYTSAYGYTTEANTWYRLVVVVDNGVRHDVYVDGVEIFQGNEQGIDGRFSLAETLLLFCAGNNQDRDDAPIDVSTVAIWDTPLSAAEVSTLGLVGDRFFSQKVASNPTPADGSDDVLITTDLAWAPGEYAATHNVYFGPSWEDVDTAAPAALIAEGLALDVNSLDIGRLDFGETYYWRVDEVNGAPDFDLFEGKVWSFTTEPFAYPIEGVIATSNADSEAGAGPENTVNGSGLNENDEHSTASPDMWLTSPVADEPLYIEFEFDHVYKMYELLVWNYNVQFELLLGFGVKNATVEYSENGVDWAVLGDVELAQATAKADYTANTTIDLQGVAAQYVRLTVNGGFGMMGQYGLSEVRFLHIPASARQPQPADGAADVDLDTILSWRAGREAAAHDVYLGADLDSLDLVDTTDETTVAPGTLLLGRTYYWRVDEVNEAASPTTWEGAVWSFSTKEYLTVEDFESYDDEDNRIYDTWLDGWVNETGSTVGYLNAPFAERSIVYSGRQSMPLAYDNSLAPFYSEAERDLGGVDWTVGGADMLRIYVQGSVDNGPGGVYVALEDSAGHVAVVTHPDEALLTANTWREWTIPFDDFSGVNLGAVRMIYVGVGDRDNPASGGTGLVFIDDIAFGCPIVE